MDQNDWAKYEMYVVTELTQLADRFDNYDEKYMMQKQRVVMHYL